jgi:hypothetical protein
MPILIYYSRSIQLGLAALVLLPACPPAPAETDSDASSSAPATATAAATTGPEVTSTTFELLCQPGEERCADKATREICKPSGLAWEQVSCDQHQVCSEDGDGTNSTSCIGPCEVAAGTPSSVGCEFLAIRVRSNNGSGDPEVYFDALIVGNPDKVEAAKVQLYFTPNGSAKEEAVGEPVLLAPGESHIFELMNGAISLYSTVRSGGVYRVVSDIPVIAYLHSPLASSGSNDSSMLLPTRSLRKDYIIASYPAFVDAKLPDDYSGRPSYFNVIALENNTKVEWTPRADTYGDGFTLQPNAAGATGTVNLQRFEVLQVGAAAPKMSPDYSVHDVSGTILKSDKPIWVLGGTACAYVPFEGPGYCNHLQEQMIPIEYWGSKYVGAHSPLRATEDHVWRVYAGEAGVTVTTDPPQPGTPFTLNERGAYKELTVANGKSFTFQGTGPFMPVQYLVGSKAAGGIGDPAMYQMIPIEQFLDRYVFATGKGYEKNYAQVIRVKGKADVKINDNVVTGYYLINAVNGLQYEVADVLLPPGEGPDVYLAESDDPFGVMIIGYRNDGVHYSAYAYPGGMALNRLVEL